jgi:hypothetical protein
VATRRKYKVPGYRDGGRVPIDTDVLIADPVQPSPPADHAAAASSPADDGNPLARALEATRRAEDLQRQHLAPQRQPTEHERFVDGLPGLSDRKRSFLKANPDLTRQDIAAVAGRHYHAALGAGIADDTDEIERYILDNVQRDIEHHRDLTAANARPTPENYQAHQGAQQLGREAESIAAEMMPQQPAPPPAPRRSMPISAPVSRDIPMASGERRPGQITLNPDERFIAHTSFPHLPKTEAELAYARNKRRMLQMKANGEIQGDR